MSVENRFDLVWADGIEALSQSYRCNKIREVRSTDDKYVSIKPEWQLGAPKRFVADKATMPALAQMQTTEGEPILRINDDNSMSFLTHPIKFVDAPEMRGRLVVEAIGAGVETA